jgi:hypothetical protein
MNKKALSGQSAMEYLMTYGWALLVIVIVIAVLALIFSNVSTEQCTFQTQGISCEPGARILAEATSVGGVNYPAGAFIGKIQNGFPNPIQVVGLVCLEGTNAPHTSDVASWPPNARFDMQVGYQGTIDTTNMEGGTSGNTLVHCYKNMSGNGNFGTASFDAGQTFTGRLYLAYKGVDDGATVPPKVSPATLVVKAQ